MIIIEHNVSSFTTLHHCSYDERGCSNIIVRELKMLWLFLPQVIIVILYSFFVSFFTLLLCVGYLLLHLSFLIIEQILGRSKVFTLQEIEDEWSSTYDKMLKTSLRCQSNNTSGIETMKRVFMNNRG
jgi:hypothetical protein